MSCKIAPFVSRGIAFLASDGVTVELLEFQVIFLRSGWTALRIGPNAFFFDEAGRFDGGECKAKDIAPDSPEAEAIADAYATANLRKTLDDDPFDPNREGVVLGCLIRPVGPLFAAQRPRQVRDLLPCLSEVVVLRSDRRTADLLPFKVFEKDGLTHIRIGRNRLLFGADGGYDGNECRPLNADAESIRISGEVFEEARHNQGLPPQEAYFREGTTGYEDEIAGWLPAAHGLN